MGNIQILTDIVASQVAAGEVVERPASIVKELVENSLDAQASRIEIEFVQSGTTLIRVSDDGIGMDRQDALLCLERHATSKLKTGSDLAIISTLGFRGEAIPSIASVSKFRMITRCREAEVGTEIIVNGGRIETVRDNGEAYGTRMEVRSLFFNIPARRKFLKGLQTEAAHIIHHLHCLALAHPGVAFVGVRDGRKFLQLAATEDLEVRAHDLFGADWMSRLVKGKPVKVRNIQIRGFLSQPGKGRIDRSEQFIFINGRCIVSPAISIPLREAYHTLLPKGYHPGAILFFEMHPSLVDCNVHPSKREVRFREAAAIGEAVTTFVEQTFVRTPQSVAHIVEPYREERLRVVSLEIQQPSYGEQPTTTTTHPPLHTDSSAPHESEKIVEIQSGADPLWIAAVSESELQRKDFEENKRSKGICVFPEQMEIQNLLDLRDIIVVGKIAMRFAILEGNFGMVVADMRAARERIIFERLLREMRQGQVASQSLLFPIVLDLPPRDVAWVAENIGLLQQVGLSVEYFGGASIKVEALPFSLNNTDISQFLRRLIDDLVQGGVRAGQRMVEEALARSVARLSGEEELPKEPEQIQKLLLELLRCELPYSCPMGKATMIPIPISELKRRLGGGG